MAADDQIPSQPPSRSARKREAQSLKNLGEALVALAPERLQHMPLSEPLREAVELAQRIKAHGGRRRQLQLIGKLLRQQDPAPIRDALARLDSTATLTIAEHHQAEHWRARLLTADNAALTEFLDAYPNVDRQQLRHLLRAARQEQAEEQPPRASRELFRLIRQAIAATDS